MTVGFSPHKTNNDGHDGIFVGSSIKNKVEKTMFPLVFDLVGLAISIHVDRIRVMIRWILLDENP